MGECVSTNHKTAVNPSPPDLQEKFGLVLIKNQQSELHFNHSPLQNSPFLSEKFSQSAARPEEVNLTFMIVNVEIDEIKNEVHITYINHNPVNIYFALGGEESINNTGLTVEITKIKYAEKVTRTEPSTKQGDKVLIVPCAMNGSPIFVIMQPSLKDNQTMFLINRYCYSPSDKKYKRKSQTLLWSHLAFDLHDIYGADNLFKCNAGEQCSVCLSSPANVIMTPCRHMCMCSECSKSYQQSSKKCPICRTEFRAIIGYN